MQHHPVLNEMRFILIAFLLVLIVAVSAQEKSAKKPSTNSNRPQLVLLSSRPRCTPQRVRSDVQCGCFWAYVQGLADREVRTECRDVLGAPISQSQSACDPYLKNDSTYNELAILDGLIRVKDKCFKGKVTFVRELSNFEILKRGEEIFNLAKKLCVLFGIEPEPIPSGPEAGYLIEGEGSDFKIIDCSATKLFIQVKDPVTFQKDNVIWKMPTDANDICAKCGSVARKVVSSTEQDSFSSFKCEPGFTCYLVETALAAIGDIFDKDVLSMFKLEGNKTEPVESAFNCTLSNSVRSSVPVSVRQQGPNVPSSCNAWVAKNADGRCTYTNCFVGVDGDTNDCFFCKPQECNNGCGSDEVNVPDDLPLVFDFKESCCIHDFCYSSTFSKRECDRAFLRDNLRSCADSVTDIFNFIQLPIPFIGGPLRCPAAAVIYYLGVAVGGGDAYEAARDAREAHEESDTCAAKCPTTQRSGGQGTTTLTIDLKKTSGSFPVSYNMFSIPDGLDIFYEGQTIFSTNGLVSGSKSVTVTYSGSSTFVKVRISAPNPGTAWDLSVGCPP